MKTVLRSHIILLTEGRFFTLLIALFPFVLLYPVIFVLDFNLTFVLFIFLFAVMLLLSIFLLKYLWPLCWGRLIITDDAIIHKCIFCRTIKINIADIKRVKLAAFKEGNAIKRDLYNTGFLYVLISDKATLPQKRIDKIFCEEGLIKFFCTRKVGKALKEYLPSPFNSQFFRFK